MDTNTVRNEVSKDVTLQRRALFGLILVALLVGLGLAGGIKGCELKKNAPVARPAIGHSAGSPIEPLNAEWTNDFAPVASRPFWLVAKEDDGSGFLLQFYREDGRGFWWVKMRNVARETGTRYIVGRRYRLDRTPPEPEQ